MPKNEVAAVSLLRPLWAGMAGLYPIPLQERFSQGTDGLLQRLHPGVRRDTMGRPCLDGESKKQSEEKPPAAFWKEAQTEATEERTGQGYQQRQGEGQFCYGQSSTADCSAAPTSTSYWPQCGSGAMDVHASATSRGADTGASGRAKAQRSDEPAQEEEGRPGHSGDRQQVRFLWKEGHQKADASRSERLGSRSECDGRRDPSQDEPHEQLEELSHSLAGKMERVHGPVSAARGKMSRGDCKGQRGSCESQSGIPCPHAGRDTGDLGRRCGHQGAERGSFQDFGRHGEHEQQSTRPHRASCKGQGRSRGTLQQEAKEDGSRQHSNGDRDRRGTRAYRWLQVACTVFSEARSVMAFGCIGQWALGPADAIIQQWNHSIVQKWWFISTWEASERALALHCEVCEDTPFFPTVPRWQGLGVAMPQRKSRKIAMYDLPILLKVFLKTHMEALGIDLIFCTKMHNNQKDRTYITMIPMIRSSLWMFLWFQGGVPFG